MRSRYALVAVGSLWCTWAAAKPVPGSEVDLAAFGRLKSWRGAEERVISRKAEPPWQAQADIDGSSNLGVEWDEPRDFSELRVAYAGPTPAKVVPEYWVSSWPAAEGRGGWTETDSAWRGSWKPIVFSSHEEGGNVIFRFEPLSEKENPNAAHRQGFEPRLRRALKIRVRFEGAPPRVLRFQVLGPSHWASRNVLIETGCEGKPSDGVFVEAYNGVIESLSSEGKVTKVQVSYLEHLSDSNDRTILTVRSGGLAFGLAMDDLLRSKGMYIRDAGIFVSDAVSGLTFASYMASGGFHPGSDIVSRVQKMEEQSMERARAEIPALSMGYRSGRHPNRYVPVGFFGNREKYGVEFNGNLFISKAGSKAFAEELSRMSWSGDTLSYRIGTGTTPDFRERENAAQQHVLDDYQPVVMTDWESEGIRYSEEAFSTLLDADLDPLRNRGDELSALLVRLHASNDSRAPRRAVVWFHINPLEDLRIRDGILEGIRDASGAYPQPRFRALLAASAGQFEIASLPAAANYSGQAARWGFGLQPGTSATLTFRITFRTLTDDASVRKLAAVDYDAARQRVTAYWRTATEPATRIHVPDELLNRFSRSAIQHILISVQRDVTTGLYMDPCGTLDYNIFANETDIQVRYLDMLGLHDLAAKFVEPMIALQGSKPFPGLFRQTDAILHGVRVDASHDYTHSGYNLNHGWTLWTLAEHYLFTRDREWLNAHLAKMRKAAEWIISERQATMRKEEDGSNVWESGLLPPGQLEDNEEWQYWFAVNAYSYRGLRAAGEAIGELDPFEGKRLASEAERYRQDIREAALHSMAASPVAPLRDGTWIPTLSTRARLHGRDYGWIRNILYGPQVLVDCGVFSPDEKLTGWILRDLEDNLFMSAESFSVPEQDWFSRGGITLQPNLVNTFVTYLKRDDVPLALRAFYNAFAVSYYPDVNAFTEWAPSFGKSGGPFFKTSDEAAFLTWLRLMLVREEGDKLYLASGAPRRWFRPGDRIEGRDLATLFGPVSFRVEPHPDQHYADAMVEIPSGFRAKEIDLRIRHPEGQAIGRVEVDGRGWDRFDSRSGYVLLPPDAGTRRIRIYYQ
jgi:hypothetical protein